MKTIDDLNQEIRENLKEIAVTKVTPRRYNSLTKKNKMLLELIRYLETNPREDFLKKEKERISTIIQSKEKQFIYWSRSVCPREIPDKKRKALFNKEIGLSALKRQLKTLSYILQ